MSVEKCLSKIMQVMLLVGIWFIFLILSSDSDDILKHLHALHMTPKNIILLYKQK